KEEELSEQDQADLALMLTIAPEVALFRRFNQRFYRLFEKDITKQCARYRRTRMVNHAAYQANPFLAKALKKISKEKLAKMIVELGWENVDWTNNHVERHNRVVSDAAKDTLQTSQGAHDRESDRVSSL
ncbi:hypothetical protein C2W62_38505, partial [Candidatus Entotheonella serta]